MTSSCAMRLQMVDHYSQPYKITRFWSGLWSCSNYVICHLIAFCHPLPFFSLPLAVVQFIFLLLLISLINFKFASSFLKNWLICFTVCPWHSSIFFSKHISAVIKSIMAVDNMRNLKSSSSMYTKKKLRQQLNIWDWVMFHIQLPGHNKWGHCGKLIIYIHNKWEVTLC